MYTSRILFYRVAVAQEIVRCAQVVSVLILWLIVIVNLFLQVISRIAKGDLAGFLCLTLFAVPPIFAMSTPPALPAPGGNATAALALATTTQPEEVVIIQARLQLKVI